MTLNITPWTPWSRACRVSWTDYTLWTPIADMTEGYAHPHRLSVAWRVMSHQHMTFDSLPFIIASSSRRNLNHRDAEPTRQTVTLGHQAQVSQTKSLSCSEFVILCSISTAVKSDCFVQSHCCVQRGQYWMRGILSCCETTVCCFLNFLPEMAHSHSSPGLDTAVSTKVLYFTDRSLTPFLINIPKR